jgi:hypothetical protein
LSEDRPLITVDGALWVLGLTAIAYAIGFGYAEGYLRHFGVDASLIEVSPYTLYRSLMWVASIAGITFVVQVLAVMLFESLLKVKVPFVIRCLAAATILAALLAALFEVRGAWMIAGGLFVVLATCLIAPIFVDRRKKERTYAEKLATTDVRFRVSAIPLPRFVLAGLAMLIPALAFQVAGEAGQTEARKQTEFLVAEASPPCAIINAHGDTLLCAEFAEGRLVGQFRFLSKADSVLTLKKVGPLQQAPKPN